MDTTTSITTGVMSLLTGAFLARLVYKGKDIQTYDSDLKSMQKGLEKAETRNQTFKSWATRFKVMAIVWAAAVLSLSAYTFNRSQFYLVLGYKEVIIITLILLIALHYFLKLIARSYERQTQFLTVKMASDKTSLVSNLGSNVVELVKSRKECSLA
jgi:hypothetical protein